VQNLTNLTNLTESRRGETAGNAAGPAFHPHVSHLVRHTLPEKILAPEGVRTRRGTGRHEAEKGQHRRIMPAPARTTYYGQWLCAIARKYGSKSRGHCP